MRLVAKRYPMKQTTIGVFEERSLAEKAIDSVYKQFNIPAEDISFLYRNTDGEVKEVKTEALIETRTSTLNANAFISLFRNLGAFDTRVYRLSI